MDNNVATRRVFDDAPVDLEWMRRAAALTEAPDPNSDAYTWLVWQWHLRETGALNSRQRAVLGALPAAVRQLRADSWVQRFLCVAALDHAGQPISGDWRTQWLARQRRLHSLSVLPAARAELLDRLDDFSWQPVGERWHSSLAEIMEFTDQHGRLPARADDPRAAGWLAAQRFALRHGRMQPERARALAALPGWSKSMNSTRSRTPWELRCRQLRAFVDANRRYPDVDSTDPGEVAAARWVTTQREQYRRDGLSDYRVKQLSALPGWRWSARDAAWDERFRELAHESRRGPIGTDHRLYSWVVAQRRRHRDGRLTPEQAARMRSLGMLGETLQAA